ncbi:MAG TPA: 50S ribosomal protein L23 [Planctomycetota bacterium]|jgi:large subunit ribosomal protein L23|nr:50S ribosomal protein L23 [Planctomycetota bacterium]OQC19589.1 MAG: 50S ribosomal protein L23 [Planctomycetes bacterium ADurb.Bin069]NMD36620.1 50S ribosomal protein L23 [Planctomycetota bacterium]HNR99000.1 50S ribosomal protein L23 [Planctomycetota bacterium]HNU27001.1 50S ribosomal protein L23 [Planctomycetota bacterium]
MKDPYTVILAPILTEKTTSSIEHVNQYTFRVHSAANKIEIRKAVETIFNVKVLRVCTRNKSGKQKRMGAKMGETRGWKEAIVHLRPGEKIDVY